MRLEDNDKPPFPNVIAKGFNRHPNFIWMVPIIIENGDFVLLSSLFKPPAGA